MKIFGCVLIFVSCLLSSHFYERYLKKRIEILEEFISLIVFIRNKIEYFSIPINKILLEFNAKTKFIKSLIENKEINCAYFDKETENLLSSFISNVGNGYKNEQIALCDYNIEIFRQKMNKNKEEYPKKVKTFRAVSLFIGISIIILLI